MVKSVGLKMLALVALAGVAACDKASDAKTGPVAKPAATTAAAPAGGAPASRDWTTVVAATPEGGFRMGNPAAPVKLVEYASLTCPHCKAFHEEGVATIKSKYVASGRVSYEYRSFLLNGPDYAAALLARCQGPAAFFNLENAFYTTQDQWTKPFTTLTPADSAELQKLPQDKQMQGLALKGGLDGFMRTRGMPRAKFDQCLTDKAAQDKLNDMRSVAISKYGLTGTPTFVINDTTQKDVYGWATLEPKLQAALK